MDVPPRAPIHDLLIAVIADVVRRDAVWPVYQYVDAVLDHEHDVAIEDALSDLPHELAYSQGGNNPQATMVATVPGLAQQSALSEDLARFVKVIARAADAERAFLPSPVEQSEIRLTPDD